MISNYYVTLLVTILFSEATAYGRWVSPSRKICLSEKPNFSLSGKRISEQKCDEYQWEMFERERIRSLGLRCRRFGIIHGTPTEPAEYPHMGAVGWKSTNDEWIFLCGTFLISEKFTITAAHCTKTRGHDLKSHSPQLVRLGATNIKNSKHEVPRDVGIEQIIIYPNYKSPSKFYDIALLKLNTVLKFTKFLQPACLWSKRNLEVQELMVTGWGVTEFGKKSNNLLKGQVDLFDKSKCAHLNNRNWNASSDHHICAGKLNGSVDTCTGDSGGPIQFKFNETKNEGTMHMVVGITSHGYRCAFKDMPAVYTKISYFIDWIEENVWPEKLLFNHYLH